MNDKISMSDDLKIEKSNIGKSINRLAGVRFLLIESKFGSYIKDHQVWEHILFDSGRQKLFKHFSM